MEQTTQRKSELFDIFKKGINQTISDIADKMSDEDEEAIEELREFNHFNRDCGSNGGFDDLSDSTQSRLIEQAEEVFLDRVDEIFTDGSDCQQIIVKIVRGLI